MAGDYRNGREITYKKLLTHVGHTRTIGMGQNRGKFLRPPVPARQKPAGSLAAGSLCGEDSSQLQVKCDIHRELRELVAAFPRRLRVQRRLCHRLRPCVRQRRARGLLRRRPPPRFVAKSVIGNLPRQRRAAAQSAYRGAGDGSGRKRG
jgi:hypothetical protein